MSDFITLTCPQCGGKLQITGDIDRFACQFCGTEHIVRRSGGAVYLAPVIDKLNQIDQNISGVKGSVEQVGTHSKVVAAELAIPRIRNEIIEAKEELQRRNDMVITNEMIVAQSSRSDGLLTFGCFVSIIMLVVALIVARYLNLPNHPAVAVLTVFGFGLGYVALDISRRKTFLRKRKLEEKKAEMIKEQENIISQLEDDLQRNLKIARDSF